MNCKPGLPVHHQLPEFTQTHVHQVSDAIQPSPPLHPLILLPASLPASESFPMSQLFAWGGQTIGVSARQGIEEVKKWHSRVRLALNRVSVVEDNVNASLRAISSFYLPMEPQFFMGGDASSSREWITIYLSQFWPMIYKGKSLKVFPVIKSHKWVKLFSSLPLYFRCYNVFS